MFRVIDNVAEAAALCRAGLAWWKQTELAHDDWPDHAGFEDEVKYGTFSILLEE